MKVNIYVSEGRGLLPRYGFIPAGRPLSLLPRGESWKYVRSGDTAEFGLPGAVEEEIERLGFWTHSFGMGLAVRTA